MRLRSSDSFDSSLRIRSGEHTCRTIRTQSWLTCWQRKLVSHDQRPHRVVTSSQRYLPALWAMDSLLWPGLECLCKRHWSSHAMQHRWTLVLLFSVAHHVTRQGSSPRSTLHESQRVEQHTVTLLLLTKCKILAFAMRGEDARSKTRTGRVLRNGWTGYTWRQEKKEDGIASLFIYANVVVSCLCIKGIRGLSAHSLLTLER
jgi:hypothetical protein